MSNWEARDDKHLMQLLVGDYFGDNPEEKLDTIRAEKKLRAAYLCQQIGCTAESVVLEVGSGVGFTSKHVAPQVKRLYCCDISDSFLSAARKECAGVPNIEFFKLDREPASFSFDDGHFDAIFSDAVFIHLNIYDIFWYFSEFRRLVKPHGKVFINIMNASRIDPDKLAAMAGYYKKNTASLKRLLCWHSVDAVTTVAAHFGFKLVSKGRTRRLRLGQTVDFVFSKR